MENEKEQLAKPLSEAAGPTDAPDPKENVAPVSEDKTISQPAATSLEAWAAYEKLKEEKAELYGLAAGFGWVRASLETACAGNP
jgi:hypothetical protein